MFLNFESPEFIEREIVRTMMTKGQWAARESHELFKEINSVCKHNK